MAGIALHDGRTWTGTEDGRTWEINGSGLVRNVFEPSFKIETQGIDSTAGQWDTNGYFDRTSQVQAFSFRRQVADWYLGPRPATGSVTFEDTTGVHRGNIGEMIRISVTVPSGTFTIFEGLITDQVYQLSADRYPQIRCTFTDWIGYDSQQTFTQVAGGYASCSLHMVTLVGASDGTRDTTQWDVSGSSNMYFPAGTTNYLDTVGQMVRGDLGMFWCTREGKFAFRAGGWWNTNRTTAVAAIGSAAGTPPDPYTYRLPHSKFTPTVSLRNILNDITWYTPYATSASQNTTSPSSDGYYGPRKRTDTVLNSVDADALARVQLLRDHTRLPYGVEGSVTFPADVSVDAMEYAARAELTDYVNVALESLEDYWQEWEEAHVLGVGHQWNPTTGWYVTLDVTTRLYEDEEE